MRILITGATGHLGSCLTRSLVQQGHDVAVYIRPGSDVWRIAALIPRVRTIQGDLSTIGEATPEIMHFAPETVFHLGWYGVTSDFRDDPKQITENLQGSLRLLEAAREAGTKCWIGIGSQAEYGTTNGILDEQTPLHPDTGYGITKLSIGLLSQELCRAYGMRHVWLRLLATYGPMDDHRRLIPSVINQLLTGQKPALTPGQQRWDYLYADDFTAALLAAAQNESVQGTFVLGSGTTRSVREIVERIRDLIDPKLPLGWGEIPYRKNQIMHLEANCSLFQRVTGWLPRITIEQGLAKTVDWYQSQIASAPRKTNPHTRQRSSRAKSATRCDMKISEYIAHFLAAQGVEQVYELVGGMITQILDAIHLHGGIRLVSMHHEQGAAFAAEGNARMNGIPGVAMATSGPGATNLLTAIGSCYFDSTPAVFITGQVNLHEQKGERAIRQLGFQETDIVTMAVPITKAAWRVTSAEEFPALLTAAFELALSGRPGPVLLDIPMNIQRAQIEAVIPERIKPIAPDFDDTRMIEEILDQLQNAQRPLILTGGGVRCANATGLVKKFIEQVNVPVISSLLGIDVVPFGHPARVGMIGTYGNRWANIALSQSDFVLVLGSRLDIRQVGADVKSFMSGRVIYHVDCEPGEINNLLTGCIPVVAHLEPFMQRIVSSAEKKSFNGFHAWQQEIQRTRAEWPDTGELPNIPGINPNRFMHLLSAVSRSASAYVVDVGQHQMWAAQSLEVGENQRFLTSGGMGAMGFALPTAIGVAFATPNQPVVVVVGDGSFQINIQELQTIVRNGLPIKIVVIDNGCHGMVRQSQETYFENRYISTFWGYSAPDFARVAQAYGIPGFTVSEPDNLPSALEWLWKDPESPALLQVKIDTLANAYPKVAFGYPISEMEPFAKPIAMEST